MAAQNLPLRPADTTGHRRRVVVLGGACTDADLRAAVAQRLGTAAVAPDGTAPLPLDIEAAGDVPAGADVWGLVVGPEYRGMTAAHLDDLPGLALLAASSTGIDHLPVAPARSRGITVARVVDYCTDEVADHTLALVLGLIRQTVRLDQRVRSGSWSIGQPAPRRIDRTVLGVWGAGAIGAAVARRGVALGMQVLMHARTMSSGRAVPAEVEWVEFDELVARCDLLTIHVALSEETRGRIDADVLGRMRPGSYLVNTARGPIVHEPDLIAALRSGQLGGAALDVLAHEPPPADDPILGPPDLVLNPHAAWYSPEAARSPAEQVADAIVARIAPGVGGPDRSISAA